MSITEIEILAWIVISLVELDSAEIQAWSVRADEGVSHLATPPAPIAVANRPRSFNMDIDTPLPGLLTHP